MQRLETKLQRKLLTNTMCCCCCCCYGVLCCVGVWPRAGSERGVHDRIKRGGEKGADTRVNNEIECDVTTKGGVFKERV